MLKALQDWRNSRRPRDLPRSTYAWHSERDRCCALCAVWRQRNCKAQRHANMTQRWPSGALKYQSFEPVAKPPSTRISFSRGPWGCALTDTKGLPGPCGPWSALHQQLASLDHTQVSFSIQQRSGIPDYALSAVKANSADSASCPPNSLPHTRHPSYYSKFPFCICKIFGRWFMDDLVPIRDIITVDYIHTIISHP